MKDFLEYFEIFEEDLEESNALSRLASLIVRKLPTTFCRILLLDGEGLVIKAAEPLREVSWDPGLNRVYPANGHLYWRVLNERKPFILLKERDQGDLAQVSEDFGINLGAAALFPLVSQGRTYGLLILGEQRSPPRVPYGSDTYLFALMAQTFLIDSERRKLSRALEEVREILEYQMEKAQIIFMRIDQDLNLLYLSPSLIGDTDWGKFLGNKEWLSLFKEEAMEVERKLREFFLSPERELEGEFPFKVGRKTRWMKVFFLKQGREHRQEIAINMFDITEMMKQRRDLEEAHQFLSSIIDQSPQGMAIFDHLGTAIRINSAFMKIFALDNENQVLGKYNILRDENLQIEGLAKRLREVYEGGYEFQCELAYDSGELKHVLLASSFRKWLRITLFPIKKEKGKPEYVIGIFSDISAEKALAEDKEHKAEQLSLLFQVATKMSEPSDLVKADQALVEIMSLFTTYIKADGGGVVFYGEQGERLSFRTILEPSWEKLNQTQLEYWLFRPIYESQGPLEDCPLEHFSKLKKEGIEVGFYLGYPLLQGADLLGMLAFYWLKPQDIPQEKREFMRIASSYLAMGLAKIKSEETLKKRLSDLEFIHRSSLDLVSSLDLSTTLEEAIFTLREMHSAQGVVIYRIEGEDLIPLYWHYRPGYLNFPDEELPQRLPKKVGHGFAGLVALTGEALLINDADRDPRGHHIEGTPVIDESLMAVPLKVKEKLLGVITVSKMGLNQFDHYDLEMLTTFASSVAVALENDRLYQEAESKRKLMENLNLSLRAMMEKREVDQLLQEVLRLAVEVIPGAQSGTLLLKEGEAFAFMGAVGYDLEKLSAIKLPDNVISRKFTVPQVVFTRQAELLSQELPEVVSQHLRLNWDLFQIKAVLSAPIWIRGELYGYFNLENKEREDAFSSISQEALSLFSQQASIAVENALLFKEKEALVERLSADLEEIQKLANSREDFLYTVSHEFKTPLMISLAAVEMEEKGNLPPEKTQDYLKVLERNLRRLSILVENILIASKKELLNDLNLQLEDIRETLKEELDAIALYGSQKGLTFHFSSPSEPVNALVDPFFFRLALANVLANAVKFSPTNSQIEVALVSDEDRALIRVSDQGRGIPPEDIPFVFDRFFRSSDHSGTSIHGTGLGLHITKQIMDAHRGKIWIESEPRKGTTVFLEFPGRK